VRLLALGLVAALNWAPLQCASDTDPALRRYETPGEALYGLSQQFKAKGDAKAWRATLEYLISRYPNSRYAGMARDDLGKSDDDVEKPEKHDKSASTDEK
jgi:hypothetical protein